MVNAKSKDTEPVTRLLEEFEVLVATLIRDGVTAPSSLVGRTAWAEASETQKLAAIIGESTNIRFRVKSDSSAESALQLIVVPGIVVLDAVEQIVDYAGLPAIQREMLRELGAACDNWTMEELFRDGKDHVAMGLARVVGFGDVKHELDPPAAQQRHPWPSEIADANRQKQAGQEQGKSNEKANGKDDGHSM